MEKLSAELKPLDSTPSKSGQQQVECLVDDLWEELQNELAKSRVITSAGVRQVTQKFMANKPKKLGPMQTERKHTLTKEREQNERRIQFLWNTMKGASLVKSSTRSSTLAVRSPRNSVHSLASSRRDEEDIQGAKSSSRLNDFITGLAFDFYSLDEEVHVSSRNQEKKTSSVEEKERNSPRSYQVKDFPAYQITRLDQQNTSVLTVPTNSSVQSKNDDGGTNVIIDSRYQARSPERTTQAARTA